MIGQLSLLLVPNMVLSKLNNHEHRTKQTYESYTFQPLWVSGFNYNFQTFFWRKYEVKRQPSTWSLLMQELTEVLKHKENWFASMSMLLNRCAYNLVDQAFENTPVCLLIEKIKIKNWSSVSFLDKLKALAINVLSLKETFFEVLKIKLTLSKNLKL